MTGESVDVEAQLRRAHAMGCSDPSDPSRRTLYSIAADALAAATARAEAAEAGEAALRAGLEALAPACWVYRSTEVTCTDLVGGELPNGATWVEDMCCLPCRLRALLATGGAE